ncbi:hypothetical protein [Sphingobium fluviale]|uniref:Uncharacterized protein n=1 Tax=Sphingobium fluviale TaxID=2506423 RepID=A0A4Q1KHW7_9SPHN|nr:hypothetical protein [Sphingobium fluviale]RXR29187.1 hypothetical protein EQG66_06750 [Sphingobium fluviale]
MSSKWLVPLALILGMSGCQDRRIAPTVDELHYQQFGGSMPPFPAEASRSKANWSAWARSEWPKACAALQVRFVFGTVGKQGRICKLEQVEGIVPVARMVSGGTLITLEGEKLPVAWGWAEYKAFDENQACAADPVDEKIALYRIVRSEPNRVWRLTQPAHKASRLESDFVKSTCEHIGDYLTEMTGS